MAKGIPAAPRAPRIAPLSFALTRGPYQNNGATPWYCILPFGSAAQPMKIALDSGSNFIWVTSSLCGPTGCVHTGGDQFDLSASSSYQCLDPATQTVSFGPWGSMQVETGADYIDIPSGLAQYTELYVSSQYSGDQFAELDWDGGIGFPSCSPQAGVSFFFADLLNAGRIDPSMPYVQFATDPATQTGTVLVGGFDLADAVQDQWLFLPFAPYTTVAGVEYIWTAPLGNLWVGDQPICVNVSFCLDSGSSCFKGDPAIMQRILAAIGTGGAPDVVLRVGQDGKGQQGTLVVPASVYEVEIQAGQDQGQTLPQFVPLDGVTDLVLAGSVLMDQLVTILQYSVTLVQGAYQLQPSGMYVFNKRGGPTIIQNQSEAPKLGAVAFSRH